MSRQDEVAAYLMTLHAQEAVEREGAPKGTARLVFPEPVGAFTGSVSDLLATWIWDGDANVNMQGNTTNRQSALLTVPFAGITEVNDGTSGHTLVSVANGIPSIAVPPTRVLYLVNAGTNDIGVEGITSAATILARDQAVVAAARARFPNCIVVFFTILPATAITAGAKENCRVAANANRLAGLTGADLVIDWASWFPNAADLTIFGDGTHIGDLGHEIAAMRTHDALLAAGIPGMPAAVPVITSFADIPGCLMELHAGVGQTIAGANITAWADQSGNGHNVIDDGRTTPPLHVADFGDGHPSVTFGGAAGTGLVHEYSSNPGVSHVVDTAAPYTRVAYVHTPGASDGFTQCFAGAVFDSLARSQIQNKTVFNAVTDESTAHGGNVGATTIESYGVWHVLFDGISGASFRGRRDGIPAVTTTLASVSFGPSTADRYAVGCWVSGGGAASSKVCSGRSYGIFEGALSAVSEWQIRYFLRMEKWPT